MLSQRAHCHCKIQSRPTVEAVSFWHFLYFFCLWGRCLSAKHCFIIHTDVVIHTDPCCESSSSNHTPQLLVCLAREQLSDSWWGGGIFIHLICSDVSSGFENWTIGFSLKARCFCLTASDFFILIFSYFCFSSLLSLFLPHLTCHKTAHHFLLVWLPAISKPHFEWAMLHCASSLLSDMQMHTNAGHDKMPGVTAPVGVYFGWHFCVIRFSAVLEKKVTFCYVYEKFLAFWILDFMLLAACVVKLLASNRCGFKYQIAGFMLVICFKRDISPLER